MKKDHIIIYIPYFSQDITINWIDTFVAIYNKKYGSMFLVDPRTVKFPGFKASLKMLTRNEVDWFRVIPKFLPFFINTSFVNYVPYFFYLKKYISSLAQGKKIIVILGYHDFLVNRYLRCISPDLVILDVCDHWERKKLVECSNFADMAITNSIPLFEVSSEYLPTKMISAGYYSHDQIKMISKNFSYKPNTVIFIATIDWRTDMNLLLYVMKKLPHFTFNFYYKDQLDNLVELSKHSQKHFYYHLLNQKNKKLWSLIKKQPNFIGKIIINQQDLSRIKIEGSVGLISYTQNENFNTFCHPVKFYNYIACGLPVVSTEVLSIQGLYPKLEMTNDRKKYVALISKANAQTWKRNDIRKNIALNHTHQLKADQIYNLVIQLLKK